MRAGARDYLTKPLEEGELVETIRWMLRERRDYARMQAFVDASLEGADLYRVDGPVNLYRLREVPDQVDKPALKYPGFKPGLPAGLGG